MQVAAGKLVISTALAVAAQTGRVAVLPDLEVPL
jgi:hypothetical protein